MARSYAQIHQRIWADTDWRRLDVNSQHLYLLLISQPQMNLAGVLPLQLRKWTSCVNGWDIGEVAAALDCLRGGRFVLVDEDTEEVLIRSLIRNDGAYKTPGMLKSILKFAEATQAPALRLALAEELGRLPALEGKTAADGMASIAATRIALGAVGGPSGPGGEPIPDGIADGIGDAFVGTHRGYLPDGIAEPIANTSVSVTGSVPPLSLVRTVVGGSSTPRPHEAPLCKRHADMDRDEIPGCRRCMALRKQWEADQEAAEALVVAEVSKPKPMCAEHPGQLADYCGPCRSERIGRDSA